MEENGLNKKFWYIGSVILMAVLVFIDQITKFLARRDLADGAFAIIDKVFSLSLVKNKGAAWGILQGRVDILSIVSIILVIAIVFFFIKIPQDKKFNIIRILCVFVSAGAIGNIIDRIGFGEVTDFLYIELINFPVFNIADCYITFSMFIFVFLLLFKYKDEDLEFISFKRIFGKEKKEQDKAATEDNVEETKAEEKTDNMTDTDIKEDTDEGNQAGN